MTRAELEALAVRVETEKPSVELDGCIAAATNQHPHLTGRLWRYTFSIDAAVTLVPEGWAVLMAWSSVGAIANLSTKPLGTIDGQEWMQAVTAKTAAAALTAAALRARAQEARDE